MLALAKYYDIELSRSTNVREETIALYQYWFCAACKCHTGHELPAHGEQNLDMALFSVRPPRGGVELQNPLSQGRHGALKSHVSSATAPEIAFLTPWTSI